MRPRLDMPVICRDNQGVVTNFPEIDQWARMNVGLWACVTKQSEGLSEEAWLKSLSSSLLLEYLVTLNALYISQSLRPYNIITIDPTKPTK